MAIVGGVVKWSLEAARMNIHIGAILYEQLREIRIVMVTAYMECGIAVAIFRVHVR
jgi:hypothetical protein